MDLSIIIPAYNEEKRIAGTLGKITKAFPKAEIIVVCDGRDRTPQVARKFGVKVYTFRHRLGKGGAIFEGIKRAGKTNGMFIDADMPTTIPDLKRMASEAGRADLTVGIRKDMKSQPQGRQALHSVYKLLVKLMFPSIAYVGDYQAGCKAFRVAFIKSILNQMQVTDFAFDVNLIYSVKRAGGTIKGVPITWIHEESGSGISQSKFRTSARMFSSLLRLRRYYSPLR
ncbi:MAG: glycosyltransferase [Candidatus Micrarchaeota archaeon]|nr:glycosyltransferase [Candidatus Micrarchaeota archaeon]